MWMIYIMMVPKFNYGIVILQLNNHGVIHVGDKMEIDDMLMIDEGEGIIGNRKMYVMNV